MSEKRKTVKILAHIFAMQKASREMSGGILHYAATHADVQVRLYGHGTPWRRMEEFRLWRPDGVIIGRSDAKTSKEIAALGCRAALFVNTAPERGMRLKHASVYCDNRAVAAAAARLFTAKKLRHFAFVGTRAEDGWSNERGEFFRQAVLAAGTTCDVFRPAAVPARDNPQEIASLAEWIAALPKPCGVFAACDARAKDVLDAAQNAGAAIPEQILVCGVDDEEFICRQTEPTLTSIAPDFHNGGYLAAKMLTRLITGNERSLPSGAFGVKGLVERLSTSDVNGANRMVCRAKEFVGAHGSERITVGDVAKAAGASIRLLQMNFKAVTGKTVRDAILSHRLQKVCELLCQTATPIGQIGELCGFGGEKHLKRLFRRRFGCSMRAYRRTGDAPQTPAG